MKEKPILMSAPMVRAILDGRKSMTRRVVKKQPPFDADFCYPGFPIKAPVWWYFYQSGNPVVHRIKCPYQIGQALWVKETFAKKEQAELEKLKQGDYAFYYRADGERDCKWKSAIFMPQWASRITLEITAVRVEKLQEITAEDCIAEGLSTTLREHDAVCHLKEQFKKVWDSLNTKRGYGWDVNPYCWVITFKRIK